MPTVPVLQRQVGTAPLPGVRLSPDAPAAAFQAPTPTDLSGVADFVARERQKADQVAVLDADNQLSELGIQLQTAALNRRGRDALGATDDVAADWGKSAAEIEKGLEGDTQKLAFRQRAMARWASLHETVERHAAGEARAYDDETTKAAVQARYDDALAHYQDPEKVVGALAEMRAVLVDHGRRAGDAPEVIQGRVASMVSRTHLGVIDRMLTTGNDLTATAYYAAHKDAVTGEDQARADKALEVGSTEGAGMRAADEAWTALGPKSLNDPVKVATLEQAIRDKFADQPKVMKAGIAELRSRAQAFNAQQTEVTASNAAAVLGAYNNGAPLSRLVQMPEYRALSGAEQLRIKEHVVDRAYALSERGRRADEVRNWSTYWELSNPEKLAELSEAQIIARQPDLGHAGVTQLLTQKRAMDRREDAVRDASIDADLFKTIAQSAGFDAYERSGKLTPEKAAQLGQLKNIVETSIDQAQQKAGRLLARTEKEAIMRGIVDQKVMIDEFGRDPEKIAALVSEDERGNAYVPIDRVPKDYRKAAINWIRSIGGIPAGTTDAQAELRFRTRLEKAFGARLAGATQAELEKILQGRR